MARAEVTVKVSPQEFGTITAALVDREAGAQGRSRNPDVTGAERRAAMQEAQEAKELREKLVSG